VLRAYYQNARSLYTFNLTFPTLALNGRTITKTENAAVFSEVSYSLFGGKVVPLVGLRYFKDHRSSDSVSNGVGVTSKATPDALTWRANLAINPSPNWMLFFNAGTGFRSGILQSKAQADAVIADGVPSSISLTPDKLRNLEVGTKGSLLDGALHVAVSLYDIKYTNIQSAFNTSIGLSAFANLGDGKAQGIDMELSWRTPLRGLTLNAIGNVNNSKFTRVLPAFSGADPRIANGLRLLNTPTHNFRLDATYEHDIGRAVLFATSSRRSWAARAWAMPRSTRSTRMSSIRRASGCGSTATRCVCSATISPTCADRPRRTAPRCSQGRARARSA
jgi:outer membrane receptor protein involved in Fe transport